MYTFVRVGNGCIIETTAHKTTEKATSNATFTQLSSHFKTVASSDSSDNQITGSRPLSQEVSVPSAWHKRQCVVRVTRRIVPRLYLLNACTFISHRCWSKQACVIRVLLLFNKECKSRGDVFFFHCHVTHNAASEKAQCQNRWFITTHTFVPVVCSGRRPNGNSCSGFLDNDDDHDENYDDDDDDGMLWQNSTTGHRIHTPYLAGDRACLGRVWQSKST